MQNYVNNKTFDLILNNYNNLNTIQSNINYLLKKSDLSITPYHIHIPYHIHTF